MMGASSIPAAIPPTSICAPRLRMPEAQDIGRMQWVIPPSFPNICPSLVLKPAGMLGLSLDV